MSKLHGETIFGNAVIFSRQASGSKYQLSQHTEVRRNLRNALRICSGLSSTYLVGRRTVLQDLLSFQGLYSPKATEGKSIQLYPQVNAVGKVHDLHSVIVLIAIIGIVDSDSESRGEKQKQAVKASLFSSLRTAGVSQPCQQYPPVASQENAHIVVMTRPVQRVKIDLTTKNVPKPNVRHSAWPPQDILQFLDYTISTGSRSRFCPMQVPLPFLLL